MESLYRLRKIVAECEALLEEECFANGYKDRWDAYKSQEAGCILPESVRVANDAYVKALHNFYEKRDGENGFLGSRDL